MKTPQVQIANILVSEKLSKEVVQRMDNDEVKRFHDESLNYIAQREHACWQNDCFTHNYKLIKSEQRLREY